MKGKNPTAEEWQQIYAIQKKMQALNKKILKMGYRVYLANDTANIMKGPTHADNNSMTPLYENSVYSFRMEMWDGGDW